MVKQGLHVSLLPILVLRPNAPAAARTRARRPRWGALASALQQGGAIQSGSVALGNARSAGAVAVSTLAGSEGVAALIDGTGAAARFQGAHSITSVGTNLYVAGTGNHAIICNTISIQRSNT